MNAENFQHKLSRIRPPRVQIAYDVHIGNAIEKKELPFVVGVLADLTTATRDTLPPLASRKFVEIDRDNFDNVMAQLSPSVEVTLKPVANARLHPEKNKVSINFFKLDHFQPVEILQRAYVENGTTSLPLADLHLRRLYLSDIVSKLQGNDDLKAELIKAIQDPGAAFGAQGAKVAGLPAKALPPNPLTLEPAAASAGETEITLKLRDGSAPLPEHISIMVEGGTDTEPVELVGPATVLSPKEARFKLRIPALPPGTKPVAVRISLAGETLEAKLPIVQPSATAGQLPAASSPLTADAASIRADGEPHSIKLTLKDKQFKLDTADPPAFVEASLTAVGAEIANAKIVDGKTNELTVDVTVAKDSTAEEVVLTVTGDTVDPNAKVTATLAVTPETPAPTREGVLGEETFKTSLKDKKLSRGAEENDYALELLRTFLNEVANKALYEPQVVPLSRKHALALKSNQNAPAPTDIDEIDLIWLIAQVRIPALEREISSYLNQILHSDAFQALERTWRGLHQLVINSETGEQLRIRVLPVSQAELLKDLQRAVEPDQSTLFKKVYEDEYGTFGGSPFSMLLGAYEFGRSASDVEGLAAIASVAASAHAPFISAAAPELFDMGSFQELGVPRDLAKIFQSPALIKWNSFRNSEDARYVALTLPRYLLRAPWGLKGKPADDLPDFNEESGLDPSSHNNFLWGNAAFALAQRITAAFATYRWTAAIRGAEGGGLVRNLPVVTFEADGGLAVKPPTEVLITDRREKELSDLGFISLCYKKMSDQAAFFGGHTVNRPILYNTDEANANSRLSAQLPYIMAMSRFAHYFKVMMRDKIGSFMTKENVAAYLNTWIADYVLLNDDAPQSLKAQNPLREARVDVFDVPGRPGVYTAVAFLRPHFQLEELTISMRLVATLPPPALSAQGAAPLLP